MPPFVSNVSSLKGHVRRQKLASPTPVGLELPVVARQVPETKETFLPAFGQSGETAMP
jgi:hypothetical protein